MKKFVSPLLNRRPAAHPEEPPAKKPKLEVSNNPTGSTSSTPPARQPTLLAPKRKPLLALKPASIAKPTIPAPAPISASAAGSTSAECYYNVLWYAPTIQLRATRERWLTSRKAQEDYQEAQDFRWGWRPRGLRRLCYPTGFERQRPGPVNVQPEARRGRHCTVGCEGGGDRLHTLKSRLPCR